MCCVSCCAQRRSAYYADGWTMFVNYLPRINGGVAWICDLYIIFYIIWVCESVVRICECVLNRERDARLLIFNDDYHFIIVINYNYAISNLFRHCMANIVLSISYIYMYVHCIYYSKMIDLKMKLLVNIRTKNGTTYYGSRWFSNRPCWRKNTLC